jgi:hypothetical protein
MAESAPNETLPVKSGRGLACKWGPDIIEQIRKMADDGLSAAQASVKMDGLLSRCAIIGLAKRRGIKFDGFVAGTDRRRLKPAARIYKKKEPKPEPPPSPKPPPKFHCFVPEEPRGMVTMLNLRDDSCRYPYDTRDGLKYCGEKTYVNPLNEKKYSWCPIHCRTVFQPS